MTGYELVAVGSSWGGLDALGTLLAGLPDGFAPAIAIAHHRGRQSGQALARALEAGGGRRVREAHDKDPIVPGRVFLAPADYHLLVESGHFALSVDEPVGYSRPSIDVLFESAADAYRERLVAVLLTGSGHDGAAGMACVRRRGGLTVAQDPETAARREMPQAAIAAGAARHVVAAGEIGPFLARACGEPLPGRTSAA